MTAPACQLLAGVLCIGFAVPATAQQSNQPRPTASVMSRPESPPAAPRVLTGKERLGPKWTDEQRIDDCNVPLDKRGKPRPTACIQSSVGF
jgi:hypothetical protein